MSAMAPITGYRELSEEDVALINMVKSKANDLDSFICALESREYTPSRPSGTLEALRPEPLPGSIDPRELALARTNLQEGFMHLVKSIAQPKGF